MQTVQVSQSQLAKTKDQEGFISHPYTDEAGVATIGYGTCFYPDGTKVELSDSNITEAQAAAYLEDHMNKIGLEIAELVEVPLTQGQKDALLDFCYNEGIGAFKESSLLKLINNRANDNLIRNSFLEWDKVHVNGELVDSDDLLRRRRQEILSWLS